MENLDLYLKNLTGKDEIKAQKAACYLVDNSDVALFKMLVNRSDFLFDFIKDNIRKRIDNAINKSNFSNIINLFDEYSPDYDDLFASILAKHANEDLTDKIFELLENGTTNQKCYAAKYFSYIPDTVAIEALAKYAFCDEEYLSYNAAEALGQMQDDISFDIALDYLKDGDDFDKLKAVKFFTAYGKNYPFDDIFNAMRTSKMPENIAGQIPYMCSLSEMMSDKNQLENIFDTFNYILSGLGEILPLSDIFQFEIYELLETLIKTNKTENKNSGRIAEILLKALSKFNLFTENQEYVFDESKETKQEIADIHKLLTAQNNDYWENQKKYIIKELELSKERVISVLPIIVEYNIKEAEAKIKQITEKTDDEIILCEALSSLKGLGLLNETDIKTAFSKIQNPNIKAIIENL